MCEQGVAERGRQRDKETETERLRGERGSWEECMSRVRGGYGRGEYIPKT